MTAKCDGWVCSISFGPFAKNVLKGIRAVLRSRNKSLEPGATCRVSTISSGNSKSISLFTCCGWNLPLVVIVKMQKILLLYFFRVVKLFSMWTSKLSKRSPLTCSCHWNPKSRPSDADLRTWQLAKDHSRSSAQGPKCYEHQMELAWACSHYGSRSQWQIFRYRLTSPSVLYHAWSPQVTSKNLSSRAMRTSHKECNLPRKTTMNVCFALCKFQKPRKQAWVSLKQFPSWTNCFMKPSVFMMSGVWSSIESQTHRPHVGWPSIGLFLHGKFYVSLAKLRIGIWTWDVGSVWFSIQTSLSLTMWSVWEHNSQEFHSDSIQAHIQIMSNQAPGLTNLGAEVIWGTWAKIPRLPNPFSVSLPHPSKGDWGRYQSWSLQMLLYKPHRTRNRSPMKGLGVTVSILLGFQAMVFAIPKSPIFKDLMPVTNAMWRTGENEFLLLKWPFCAA